MSYRVEVAPSGRAGCQSTDCKKAAIKIGKNELRLGTWVDIPDRGGSWRWRHWGCVTGKILLNIRQALDQSGSGEYNWKALDGYEGFEEKSSLHHHPDLQAKVRRVITQGFIDPEDFKGDPEMNKIGSTGLRTASSKRKKKEKDNEEPPDLLELRKQLDALTAEREKILAQGASPSKIEIQLKIVKDALSESENAKVLEKKQQMAQKKSRKRTGRHGYESESEGLEDIGKSEEKLLKKQRISAKVDKTSVKTDKVQPQSKTRGKKLVKKENNPHNDEADDINTPLKSECLSSLNVKEETDEDIDFHKTDQCSAKSKRHTRKMDEKKDRANRENDSSRSSQTNTVQTKKHHTENRSKSTKESEIKSETEDDSQAVVTVPDKEQCKAESGITNPRYRKRKNRVNS
ncbi:putative zf-parp type zinc finger protein [Golovinomyces cichoracearum]|uniref:Putative zf-parp type zinc finger protein n=1 Tax=Golovinomyces cichoracearum TaxID=62708 RepID=A0A420J3P6_9PEZI|nr:putative zf-parp type zinc finger protein [Golovinomyces cichoracearum]